MKWPGGRPVGLEGRPGLAAALWALTRPSRKPTEEDAPPVSTFPMTPAAREAIRERRAMEKRS